MPETLPVRVLVVRKDNFCDAVTRFPTHSTSSIGLKMVFEQCLGDAQFDKRLAVMVIKMSSILYMLPTVLHSVS